MDRPGENVLEWIRNQDNDDVTSMAAYQEHPVESIRVCFHRDCQTSEVYAFGVNTDVAVGTQQNTEYVYITDVDDQVLPYSAQYVPSDSLLRLRDECAVLIQKVVRGMLTRQKLRRDSHNARGCENDDANPLDHRDFEQKRRFKPRNASDVLVLKSELQLWVNGETETIKSKYRVNSVTPRLNPGLRRELKELLVESSMKRSEIRLPKSDLMQYHPGFVLSKGELVEVINEQKEGLVHLYNQYMTASLSREEHVGVVREALRVFEDSDLEQDEKCGLSELFQRELDLLTRGRPLSSMVGLRLRITNTLRSIIMRMF